MEEIKKHLMSLPCTKAEERWLRERLETLSVRESYQLAAAIQRTAPKNGVDAVNCVLSMGGYDVWGPAEGYAELGEFYLRREVTRADEVLPHADLDALGRHAEDAAPGLFIGAWYVVYPARPPSQIYHGDDLPIMPDMDWSVKLKLSTYRSEDSVWIRLPDYRDPEIGEVSEMTMALAELGVQKIDECELLEARCILPEAGNLMEQYSELADLIYDGEDLGFLLDEAGQGTPQYMPRYMAALEYEHCRTLKFALDIAQNINCYDFITTEDTAGIAKKELEKRWRHPQGKSVLEDCIDLDSYGAELLEQQGYQMNGLETAYIRRNERVFQYDRSDPPQEMGMTM